MRLRVHFIAFMAVLLAILTSSAAFAQITTTSTPIQPPPSTSTQAATTAGPTTTAVPTPYPTPEPPTPEPNPNTPAPGRTMAGPTLAPLENQTIAGGTYAALTSVPTNQGGADLPLETWLIVLLVFIGVILCGLMIYAAKRGRQSMKDKTKHKDRLERQDKEFDDRLKKIEKL